MLWGSGSRTGRSLPGKPMAAVNGSPGTPPPTTPDRPQLPQINTDTPQIDTNVVNVMVSKAVRDSMRYDRYMSTIYTMTDNDWYGMGGYKLAIDDPLIPLYNQMVELHKAGRDDIIQKNKKNIKRIIEEEKKRKRQAEIINELLEQNDRIAIGMGQPLFGYKDIAEMIQHPPDIKKKTTETSIGQYSIFHFLE